jgi:peptidoglycan/LPS O-acetylase OafA/YrhL
MAIGEDQVRRTGDDGQPVPETRAMLRESAPVPKPPAIPSLDGLRAIAVLIVVAAHSGFGNTIPGGLGVTVFFFLSGFLITTLLVDEHARSGSIHVPHFYLRRAYRLLPPLVVTLTVAYALVVLDRLGGGITLGGLASQLFYFANYFQIFWATPASQPDGTGILWSLAVEEHFYIMFPVVILLALRLDNARRFLLGTFLTLCVLALAWRTWLVSQDVTELRTYYATDTRFDSILFGCVLALWRNPARLPRDGTSPPMHKTDWLLLAGALTLMSATIVYRDPSFRDSARYTLQGLALMPVFYFAVRNPTAGPFRLLNSRVLARIGVLSYGIYLTHAIALEALTQNVHVDLPPLVRFGIAVAASAGFASVVDRYVDPYFRRRRAALH